ncbi:MAG: N-acetyltransferase [Anaerolineae bacterium]|nr:N-acetyltransferase family protein [Anaerolineales bacterium]MCQ3978123.1 N-acetyltransferase [Anaerolineae bacterium]
MLIRPAQLTDLAAITAIYNEAILTTVATFDTEPKSESERAVWFSAHDARHPILVAEIEGQVVGWASLSKWSDRLAYADTAEISLYVHSSRRGQGIGKQLIAALVAEGEKAGLRTLIARIAAGNEASVRLHQTAGFELIGVMREVGRKFDQLLDIHLMQKIY